MALRRSLLSYFVNYLKNLVDKCSNFTSAYACLAYGMPIIKVKVQVQTPEPMDLT